jgi:pSer/pThr/pTyr-binding forkhead associated (FHA) protein
MSDNGTQQPKKSFSLDWLVRGVLTKIGQSFDKLTGRDWKPSSSLATSELIERLKRLLDVEVKDLGAKGRFVPHHIKLKMQWDKFSADAEDALRRLQYELHAAAIDHINDNRYHTYAPIKVEVKPDYFTEGVNLMVSFDKFADEGDEAEKAIKVTMPDVNLQNIIIGGGEPELVAEPEPETEKFIAEFRIDNKLKSIELEFEPNKRLNVGRTKENHLAIEDASVSKVHASLMLNAENQLLVADTGSTNGTFVNNQRIAYGKAFPINDQAGDKVKFGTIEVFFRRVPKPVEFATRESFSEAAAAATADFKTEEVTAVNRQQQMNKIYSTNQNHPLPTGADRRQNTNVAPPHSPPPPAAATSDYQSNQNDRSEQNFQTNQSYRTNNEYSIEGGAAAAENKKDGFSHEEGDNGGQSQRTEQRVNFKFGDDGNGGGSSGSDNDNDKG